MESGDWRDQLQRQTFLCKIMDTLKRHLPFSKYERLQELKKIAERVEQEIYTTATNQSEYTRKICFMMLTMETRLQNPVRSKSNADILYNSVNPSVPLDSSAKDGDWQEEVYQQIKAMKDLYLLDSTAQTGNPNGEDVQEEVYQKIKAMKDLYLLDLFDMHQKIVSKFQQLDSLPQQPENEVLEKLKVFKNMLERYMQFLQIPKHGILANYKDKLCTYERQIISVINVNKGKPRPSQQQSQA
ncbi:putative coactivator CBP, KIX domain superfamily, mediator complex subunit 15, KIX [Helianthus annuus]|nr:putative coactivator CBP, KIX domain superfamily, mediator complex subunit 15, KIX [Helianthus annuus]KAJ0608898.1 putative coactivator CBP, KIX domain superfamily, mediator complex subunit 15, KIX [Helianthus annuus]KAJ0944654.1 putative mediator complex subunit 15, KIX domain-containing protein [Helianthus annuus]